MARRREDRGELRPLATLGPRAAKSEEEARGGESRGRPWPGPAQPVSACAIGAAFGKNLINRKGENLDRGKEKKERRKNKKKDNKWGKGESLLLMDKLS